MFSLLKKEFYFYYYSAVKKKNNVAFIGQRTMTDFRHAKINLIRFPAGLPVNIAQKRKASRVFLEEKNKEQNRKGERERRKKNTAVIAWYINILLSNGGKQNNVKSELSMFVPRFPHLLRFPEEVSFWSFISFNLPILLHRSLIELDYFNGEEVNHLGLWLRILWLRNWMTKNHKRILQYISIKKSENVEILTS